MMSPLTAAEFIAWLKDQSQAVGLDRKKVSGHSLRRGGATALFVAGVDDPLIMLHGRWRSLGYRQYFDDRVDQFAATRQLLARGAPS
jgi:hypothetical protein